MRPKEKANELYSYYDNLLNKDFINPIACDNIIKQCVLKMVDEIIEVCPYISKNNCTSLEQVRADDIEFSEYWQEVKQEIEKL